MTNFPEASLNINLVREGYQNDFVKIIEKFPSPKLHNVINSFILQDNLQNSSPECRSVVFIITSKVATVDALQNFLKRDIMISQNKSKQYDIIAVPRFSFVCKNFLKQKNVINIINSITELPITIVPVESDVLSMEEPKFFADGIYQFVQGLMRFQSIFGLFPRIVAKGEKAVEVANMLKQMRQETSASTVKGIIDESSSQTDMLILIDRTTDPLTPFLQQLTYAGLIDEKWGIQFGLCRPLGTDLSSETAKISLNSSDLIYNEIRDQNFSAVGSILSQRSREVSSIVTQSKSAKDITDLKRVVDQIPEIRSKRSALEIHTSIAEKIQKHITSDEFLSSLSAQQDFLNGFETDKAHPYIENCILQAFPLSEVLRLICIQCFCNGGLKQRLLDYYKSEILQVYGFEHIFTLNNLESVGLIYETSGASNLNITSSSIEKIGLMKNSFPKKHFSVKQLVMAVSSKFNSMLKRNLQLVVPLQHSNCNGDVEQALSSIYSGFIPISIRLIQVWTCGWVPRLFFTSSNTQAHSLAENALSKATNALRSGSRLISGLRFEESMEMTTLEADSHLSFTRGTNIQSSQSQATFLSSFVPAPEVNDTQLSSPSIDELISPASTIRDSICTDKSRVIVVGFIGGVTQAEVSALRTLSASEDYDVEFVIITTGFITATSFLDSLSHNIQPTKLITF